MEDSIYIKRLKERLRQNPDSKVFLSLAEELRKKDMMDEAIAVLIGGIKKQPDFIGARLTLGRWYLLSDMLSEAQKEYSEVIKRSPDNIFASKGLQEINKRLGYQSNGVSEYGSIGDTPTPRHPDTPIPLESLSSVGREAVVDRLNKFLEEIKIRFAYTASANKDKGAVMNRLNSFLNAVKIHFASLSGNFP